MIELRRSIRCEYSTAHPVLQLAGTTSDSHGADGACMSEKPLRVHELLALLPPCNEHRGTGLSRRPALNRQRAAKRQTGNAEYPMVHPRGKGGCAPCEKESP